MNKTMTARFNDSDIIKAILEDNSVKVVTLDEDGDEVVHSLNLSMPAFTAKIVNNSSDPAFATPGILTTYGLDKDTEIEIPVGDSMFISEPFGTQDGSTYIGIIPIADYYQQVLTSSELVNCMEYGGMYVILDPTADASCTITVTDHS